MKAGSLRKNLKERQVWIVLILGLCVMGITGFFLLRSVLWSRQDEQASLLRIVSLERPLESAYRPRLGLCRGVELEADCAEAMERMLQAAEQADCSLSLGEGYLSRETLRQRYEQQLLALAAKGLSPEAAELQLMVGLHYPGTSEHELGLSADLSPAEGREKECQRWLREHSWEYGFVLRYPEGKLEWTGRELLPWHYRYVGPEAAAQMQQLDLCLEEYTLWFYSDDAIILLDD